MGRAVRRGAALGDDPVHQALEGAGGAAANAAVSGTDAMAYSVMSYRSYAGVDTTKGYLNETFGYAQTPMARDIAAIQHLYGANY